MVKSMERWAAVLQIRMKTIAQKVDAKNAMKPEATPISRLANQPMLPRGIPKRLPELDGPACAAVGEECVIQFRITVYG
jgi:hypothetical protein